MKGKKRSGYAEALFNSLYLGTVLVLGVYRLLSAASIHHLLFGIMALVLLSGDAFHLLPRIASALSGDQRRWKRPLGIGKLITSVGMTLFYALLWTAGLLWFSPPGARGWTLLAYGLAAVRILLSVLPQNQWGEGHSPMAWTVYRNLPFLLLGGMVGLLFFFYRDVGVPGVRWMWLAILCSFACYLPVVFGAKKYPLLGLLMIPKSCAYVWILTMGL